MQTKKIIIIDPIGIHARPASLIVNTASKFVSKIEFKYDGKLANAKSIINLMALGVKKDAEIDIIIDGSDDEQAMNALIEVMEKEKLI
ncbi:MAG: HPr family phosphocarrier protein [Mycoplasmoidaceae bacterium]